MTKMTKKIIRAYIMVAVFTLGQSLADSFKYSNHDVIGKVIFGSVWGALWPLYWSKQINKDECE